MTDTAGNKNRKRRVTVRSERVAAVVTGGALALYGLRRRSIGGAMLGLVGGALAYRGATAPAGLLGIATIANRTRTLACSPEEAYRFLRNVVNVPRVMDRVIAAVPLDSTRSQWTFLRAGKRIGWTVVVGAEIVVDTPGELITWRFDDAGGWRALSAHFRRAPGGRGTEVRVAIEGERVPALEEGLRRMKQLLEAGEIATPATRGT